jgi:hypothetical protein
VHYCLCRAAADGTAYHGFPKVQAAAIGWYCCCGASSVDSIGDAFIVFFFSRLLQVVKILYFRRRIPAYSLQICVAMLIIAWLELWHIR